MSVNANAVPRKRGIVEKTKERVISTRPERLLTCMRLTNIIASVLGLFVGISTFIELGKEKVDNKRNLGIVAFFCIIFSMFLLLFELRIGKTTKRFIKRNFGFMYAHRGKALSIFFLSTLCFSAVSKNLDRWYLNFVFGLFILLDACFGCFVYYWHPTFYELELGPKDLGVKTKVTKSVTIGNSNQSFSNAGYSAQQPQPTGPFQGYQFGNAAERNKTKYANNFNGYNESPFAIEDNDADELMMNDMQRHANNNTVFIDTSYTELGSTNLEQNPPDDSPFSAASTSSNSNVGLIASTNQKESFPKDTKKPVKEVKKNEVNKSIEETDAKV